MKFSFLETAKERSQAYKTLCLENDQKRAAARKEVEEAKAEERSLMNRQIEGEDVFEELTKAQVKIKIAEEKYQRVINDIGERNPEMDFQGISFTSVQSEFQSYLNGDLQADMENELSELTKARDRYLAAAEKALIKFYCLRSECRQESMAAESFFGQPVTGKLPLGFDEYLLRPAGLWLEGDANCAIAYTKRRALESVEGPTQELKEVRSSDKRIIPKPKVTTGPREWVDENGVSYYRAYEVLE